MAIFIDFVPLYKKKKNRIKMSRINESEALAFSVCTLLLASLCGAWPQTQEGPEFLRSFCFEVLRLSTSSEKFSNWDLQDAPRKDLERQSLPGT